MPAAKKISIGTRGSKLALAQAEEIKNRILSKYPVYQDSPDLISIIPFKTTGDKITNKPLVDIGGKGLFIKEIEEALLAGQINIAVHSMKDMPGFFSDGLDIFSVPERQDSRDAFISRQYSSIATLPSGATVGTSSPRRAALILHQRPDLKIINFRGNVDTRLNKLEQKQVDATILAVAGLERISMQDHITSIIDKEEMLPAVGQGALALQARIDDDFTIEILKSVNHHESKICVDAERSFLKTINGSCKTPLAANCKIQNNQLHLKTLLASLDGKEIYQTFRIGNLQDGIAMGKDAGEEIRKAGKHILDKLC
ncbi:MAG: hydroxymethylbilane synthase [Rickettsiaceae bacterium]|jgi:hydroxymethylbilane synthase|nr:hydroxymethylbilane synthase [Rickettsiaceae bacterium]